MIKSNDQLDLSSLMWLQTDQKPVICKEKIKILTENHVELMQMMQDAFEDAMLMGVDEQFMRSVLKEMIDQLRSPVV
ncbi:hypothetical protein [Commensalibacter oyaizuii]|uniref:Uncharacterized protein n=1 Tax=Commensalibacter oyaizuii TaxID=3043873 RepID=A0ABT6Q1A2_9PROT|nr:hypothetical protein [Commensalibacter sp. TBRC 16381]MDI2090882.1 hypothetical protein [Commensalibacter sp. TBRC 16381]